MKNLTLVTIFVSSTAFGHPAFACDLWKQIEAATPTIVAAGCAGANCPDDPPADESTAGQQLPLPGPKPAPTVGWQLLR
jgi:hypothetical protein